MKKFLEDLRRELTKRNIDPQEIDEIISDHEEMIRTALADGLAETDIASRFGDPSRLAEDLVDETKAIPVPGEDSREFKLWKSFPVVEDGLICDLHLISEDVTVQTTSQKEIRLSYATPNPCQNVEAVLAEYQVTYQNGLFSLNAPKQNGFLFSRNRSCDLRLLIEIPEDLSIADFGFWTVSGNAKVMNLKTESLDFNTTSGDVSLHNLKAGSVRLNTVSGDVNILGAVLKSFVSNQVSGDLSINDLRTEGQMKIQTVSGDASVRDSVCDECEMDSVSGDINGTEFYPRQVSLRSVSGDICLKNREPNRVQIISQKTKSGEIHIH